MSDLSKNDEDWELSTSLNRNNKQILWCLKLQSFSNVNTLHVLRPNSVENTILIHILHQGWYPQFQLEMNCFFFQLFHFTQQNIGYYQIKKIIPLWILSFHYCCNSVEDTLLYFFSNHGWYPLIEWEKAFFFHWFFNCFSLPSAPL